MKNTWSMVLLLYGGTLCAQYNPVIRTGRPGQAIGPFTVGKNIFQAQQGVDYGGSSAGQDSWISDNVIRFGIMETMELSALINYQHIRQSLGDTTFTYRGFSSTQLGFRVHLNDQRGLLPTTGFQMRLRLPSLSADYPVSHVAPVMVLVTNWGLPGSMTLGINWIVSYSGNDEVPTGKYVCNFGFPVCRKLSGFIENYGQLRADVFETRMDGGFAYLLNNDVQLDVLGGYGRNSRIEEFFVSCGISWRINLRPKPMAPAG